MEKPELLPLAAAVFDFVRNANPLRDGAVEIWERAEDVPSRPTSYLLVCAVKAIAGLEQNCRDVEAEVESEVEQSKREGQSAATDRGLSPSNDSAVTNVGGGRASCA